MGLSNWLRGLAYRTVKIGGSEQVSRAGLDLIAGTNVTLVPQDSSAEGTLKVTINALGGGASDAAELTVDDAGFAVLVGTDGQTLFDHIDDLFAAAPTETIAIATGVLTLASSRAPVAVDAESGTADELFTISGGIAGQYLTLQPAVGDTITILDNSDANGDNIKLSGQRNVALTHIDDRLYLRFDGTYWNEIGRKFGASYVNNIAGATHTFTIQDCFRDGGVASTGGSATEFTIDQVSGTAYPVGAMIAVTQRGTGALTIGATSTATLNGSSGAAVIALTGQYSAVVLHHVSSNVWVAYGDYS